jgi:hypothetical protein
MICAKEGCENVVDTTSDYRVYWGETRENLFCSEECYLEEVGE